MGNPPSSTGIFHFGVFDVDARLGELRKHGLRLRLQEKPFQILVYLLERPGELVTRGELRQRLWDRTTYVDFEHSLNNAVNKLREALSDDPDKPRFIETVPRRGYRFIGALVKNGGGKVQIAAPRLEPLPAPLAATEQELPAPTIVQPAQPAPRKRIWLAAAGALVLALAALGVALIYRWSLRHKEENKIAAAPPLSMTTERLFA